MQERHSRHGPLLLMSLTCSVQVREPRLSLIQHTKKGMLMQFVRQDSKKESTAGIAYVPHCSSHAHAMGR